jgi:3',5'-cyclic AMP phosphodiesterase CpdA
MKILHISDIHFGYMRDATGAKLAPIEPAHVFSDKSGEPKPEVLLDLITSNNNLVPPPELVIASGDIGWSADEEDYTLALTFFRGLKKAWPTSEVCIIPGNHDVQLLGAISDDKLRQNNFFKFLLTFYPMPDLCARFPLLTEEERLTGALEDRERLSYIHLREDNVLIMGLNSAASITNFNSPIFISNDHLAKIEKYMVELIPPYRDVRTRIAAIHHHVLPFVESPL